MQRCHLPANVVNSHIRLSIVHTLTPPSYCSQLGPAPCYNIYIQKRYVRTTPCPVLSVCLAVAIRCPVLFASTASCNVSIYRCQRASAQQAGAASVLAGSRPWQTCIVRPDLASTGMSTVETPNHIQSQTAGPILIYPPTQGCVTEPPEMNYKHLAFPPLIALDALFLFFAWTI